jgi:hypothetical protein
MATIKTKSALMTDDGSIIPSETELSISTEANCYYAGCEHVLSSLPVGSYESINKTEFSKAERIDLAATGQAMPDGSFPIRNEQDLLDAIASVGRARDYDVAKAWIIKRAEELNLTKFLPESWQIDTALDANL